MKPDPLCSFCRCPLSRHCPGEVSHGNYKEEARMMPIGSRQPKEPCKHRHCLAPLCCCPDFEA